MNHQQNPEALWSEQKEKLKLLFPHLVDDDFRYDYGMKDVMMNKLQVKLSKSRNELNELLIGL
jgi:hypothetical protein